jgi:hypothetical protein
MRLFVVGTVCVVISASIIGVAVLSRTSRPLELAASAECAAEETPLGALPPAVPGWCGVLATSVDTAIASANTWADSFASGASHAAFPRSYVVFENARKTATGALTSVNRTQHFAHNGHWMVDIAGDGAPLGIYEGSAKDFYLGPNNGGALMRPDASFRFEDDRLVVEFEVSAGMTAYGDRVWPEIVVTTAPAPSSRETNGWYAAGLFGGYPAIGCAFPSDRLSECRVYDSEKITANLSAGVSAGAARVFGGTPTEAQREAWRLCAPADNDAACRDRFRIELSRESVTIRVNGMRYMEHSGLPLPAQLPDALVRSPVYVYFASWAYLVDPTVARVHWGRVAINPLPSLMR